MRIQADSNVRRNQKLHLSFFFYTSSIFLFEIVCFSKNFLIAFDSYDIRIGFLRSTINSLHLISVCREKIQKSKEIMQRLRGSLLRYKVRLC